MELMKLIVHLQLSDSDWVWTRCSLFPHGMEEQCRSVSTHRESSESHNSKWL